MAQVYVPNDPKVRKQLEQPSQTDRLSERTDAAGTRTKRRFGFVDVLLILIVIAAITLLVAAASRWTARLNPSVQISLSFTALPAYAGYSLLRMMLGYLLSLIFTLVYGHIAATNRRAGSVMVPLLDILQSIPILSFLPAVLFALVAIFPHSNIGLELSSIILIFTSQAWNMTFSFCQSVLLLALVGLPGGLSFAAVLLMLLGTQWYILFNVIAGAMSIPSDLREATTIFHVKSWRRWRTLILPAVFPYLTTGLLTASGGAWNASIVSEYVQFNGSIHQTVGLGATIAAAAAEGKFPELLAGTLLMATFVVIINRLVWKRMYALAERRCTLG